MSKNKHQSTEPQASESPSTPIVETALPQVNVQAEPDLPNGIEKGSHLYMAMRAIGARNLQELQRIQAEQRAAANGDGPTLPIAQMAADLASLQQELQEMNAILEDLQPKVEKANAKIAKCFARKCELEQAITNALKVPEGVSNQQYLEGQKKQRIEEFKGALAAKQAIKDAGVEHLVKIDKLKLGISPLDQAIEQQNLAEQRIASQEAMKAG